VLYLDTRNIPPLLNRREVWVPTFYGWLVLFVLAFLLVGVATYALRPFLAVTAPVGARTIVVEGWMDTEALDEVVRTLAAVPYDRVITTGGPRRAWPTRADLPTYADAAASYLRQHGVPGEKIVAVRAPYTEHDHTYVSALAVRLWVERNNARLDSVDVFSVGAHTRRSRLLFEMALGPSVKVGSYAASYAEYERRHWWRTSAGARDVVEQALGYVWVMCCFWPG
jgi:hypothetical protein